MTIKEFAEQMGLSTATVSRAFTPGGRIHADTRAQILERARELGYAPNPSARNLARRHNRLIGLDCPANADILADPFLIQLARGVQAALEQQDYGLLLNTRTRSDNGLERLHEWVFGHAVDGVVIVVPPDYPLQTLCPFVAREVPSVLITQARKPEERVLPSVEIDLVEGARAALTHLVRLGHSQIGLIAPFANDGVYQMYQQVMKEVPGASGGLDPRLTAETSPSIAEGRAAMHRLLAAPTPPTAVFCRTDLLALGALAASRDMGLRVPDDLSIIGHDDLVLAELSDPPLTTVRIDTTRIGQEAANLLLASLASAKRGKTNRERSDAAARTLDEIPTVSVRSELIVRRSTTHCPERIHDTIL